MRCAGKVYLLRYATRPLPFSSLFPRLQHTIVTKVQLVPVLAFTADGRYLLGQQPVKVRTARRRAEGPLHPQLFLFLVIASRASLSAVLRRSVSRLSQCVLPMSLCNSFLCTSNFRVRRGSWLKMLPCS